MRLRTFKTLTFCGLLGLGGGYFAYNAVTEATLANLQTAAGLEQSFYNEHGRKNVYGDYLSSQFAQQHHDWKLAGEYLNDVMAQTPDDAMVLKRAMILSMGAGETKKSLDYAKRIAEIEKNDALALLFLASGALHEKNYAKADEYLKAMPPGSLSDFIMPLLQNWAEAGLGRYNGEKLTGNIVHLHHAILMADYLDKKKEIAHLLEILVASQVPTPPEMERIGDIYAHIEKNDNALEYYQKALRDMPENAALAVKINALKAGGKVEGLGQVTTPEQGVAMALYNMAQILYQENADDSARVFANIALYLDPNMTDAQLLLAAITSRNEQTSDAIQYYRSIKADSEYYVESRRRAAELLETSQRTDEALQELRTLVTAHNDIESLIQIGDIYRRQEDFQKALTTYNEAAARFGEKVPKEFWHLLYARGMSLERLGQWDKAESDLRAALSYQPDHPYVLNYLAYAWTDKGVNLNEALSMLQKAVQLRPDDGYITDSLGWVYYRLGKYKEAVPSLEAAVELLPYDPVINDHLGDAYWQAGRKTEARFQWQRAKNFSDDTSFISSIDQKLAQGLNVVTLVKQAHSNHPEPSQDQIMNP